MEYDILYSGSAVCLVNCFVYDDRVEFGFGHFAAESPPVIALYDENKKFITKINPPDDVVNQFMPTAMGDVDGCNVAKRIY